MWLTPVVYTEIAAINCEARQVVLRDGVVYQITDFFDGNDKTNDWTKAQACVAGQEGVRWLSINLSMFVPARIH